MQLVTGMRGNGDHGRISRPMAMLYSAPSVYHNALYCTAQLINLKLENQANDLWRIKAYNGGVPPPPYRPETTFLTAISARPARYARATHPENFPE